MNIKQRQVLKHAQQLFVEKGIVATSIQDILTKANISKGTFYNYFPSKNDCLKTILKLSDEEISTRRQELLIGQRLSDRKVLTKQIDIRLQVNIDHNLLPIFEAIFHSGDADLSAFAKDLHVKELHWLADRFVDVYGEKARPYAADCSILFTGMLQHTLFFRRSSAIKIIESTQLIDYLVRRMEFMIPSIIDHEDILFGESLFELISIQENEVMAIKMQLLKDLAAFQKKLARDPAFKYDEFTTFLLDEIEREVPRLQLLKSITQSFRLSFKETNYEQAAFKLASEIWIFIEKKMRK